MKTAYKDGVYRSSYVVTHKEAGFRSLALELPEKIWERVDKIAKTKNISRAALARQMIAAQVQVLEEDE